MIATAKVFTTGNSQAIRLPKAFRVNTPEVWITKTDNAGGMAIQPKPTDDDLESFLAELHALPPSDEFLPPRDDAARPNPFEDWVE
jgi:antitoxin VapB